MDLILIYFVVINVIAFLMFGADKWKAKKDRYRIPEKTLLGVAILGGSIGAGLGMWLFRHKTRKMKFYLSVPAIFLIQAAVAIYFSYYF